jgi:hypothetical protein
MLLAALEFGQDPNKFQLNYGFIFNFFPRTLSPFTRGEMMLYLRIVLVSILLTKVLAVVSSYWTGYTTASDGTLVGSTSCTPSSTCLKRSTLATEDPIHIYSQQQSTFTRGRIYLTEIYPPSGGSVNLLFMYMGGAAPITVWGLSQQYLSANGAPTDGTWCNQVTDDESSVRILVNNIDQSVNTVNCQYCTILGSPPSESSLDACAVSQCISPLSAPEATGAVELALSLEPVPGVAYYGGDSTAGTLTAASFSAPVNWAVVVCMKTESDTTIATGPGYALQTRAIFCPAGFFCPDGSDISNPVPCGAGMYSGESALVCTPCPANTYSTVESSACTPCPSGQVSSSGSSSCTAFLSTCAAGKYAATTTTCTSCAAGKYAAAGASTCSTCDAGKYSANGATTCTACSTGTAASTGASSCGTCAAGKYAGAAAGSCTTCPAGKFTAAAGASSCSICPAGKSSSSGSTSCAACSQGYVAAAGASSCTLCTGTTYASSGGSTCLACPEGYICPLGLAIACGAGSACSGGRAVDCPANTYSAPMATACTPCPEFTNSGPNAASCSSSLSVCPNSECRCGDGCCPNSYVCWDRGSTTAQRFICSTQDYHPCPDPLPSLSCPDGSFCPPSGRFCLEEPSSQVRYYDNQYIRYGTCTGGVALFPVPSATPTRTPSTTSTRTASRTGTSTRSASRTGTASHTPTPSITPSNTRTPSVTPSNSRTPSTTPTQTPTPSYTFLPTPSPYSPVIRITFLLSGVNVTVFPPSAQAALIAVTAALLAVPTSTITFLGVGSGARLLQAGTGATVQLGISQASAALSPSLAAAGGSLASAVSAAIGAGMSTIS